MRLFSSGRDERGYLAILYLANVGVLLLPLLIDGAAVTAETAMKKKSMGLLRTKKQEKKMQKIREEAS